MATSQTEIQSQVIDLSTEAFDAFCNDIAGMFDVDMECSQQEVVTETVEGLKKRFKKLVAVNSVKAEGTLDGTFQLIFDQKGLFTLAGIIVMLPEQKILRNGKNGSKEDAQDMSDALSEAGNMLVGSWDKLFREELEGHGHFVQINTFIGNPWNNPKKKIGLADNEDFVLALYEMTIASYPPFTCGVIFSKSIFGNTSESDAETAATVEEKDQTEVEEKPEETKPEGKEETEQKETTAEKTDSEEADSAPKSDVEESKSQEPPTEKTPVKEDPEAVAEETDDVEKSVEESKPQEPPTEKTPAKEDPEAVAEETDDVEKSTAEKPKAAAEAKTDNVEANDSDSAAAEQAAETTDSADNTNSVNGGVSDTIQRMTQSPAELPGEHTPTFLTISAKDIMQKEVIWANPDDTVQQALTKMQQHDVGYIMIGTDGAVQGIVSKSDITGAISTYLRPVFAKWRRPLDDATLQIKVKWIMARPVRTIKPETALITIMENMRQFAGRCLPVMDEQGKIQGLVTVFDIFKALLRTNPNISTAGKTSQSPPLA